MRYFIRLSFNGSRYGGWQIQRNAPAVQAEVERALSLFTGETIQVLGAGRTDAGVHALNYIAHFDSLLLDLLEKHFSYAYKLNAILSPDICIHAITPMHEKAHARFDALLRTYRYRLHATKNPFFQEFSTFCPYDLNLNDMNNAASLLLGTHDFTSFSKSHSDNKTSLCTVTHADFVPENTECFSGIIFTITANRFLRNMVRAIVGTLIDVGRAKISPEQVAQILQQKDRQASGSSVPPQGLCLCRIEYPYPVL
ncbi:MAG: tRNA pseudouridine(38-40) synthase TruA [Prevotellaceae bacterium]|jgi:tRNA pseudouridine38-40 synthase|nr:tRNA pseudouridine(38-40) synthase TruA [Prevotellaceae bacterium]